MDRHFQERIPPMAEPASPRVVLRRHPERGDHDLDTIKACLDSQFLCHLAFEGPDGPICLPTCHGRIGDILYVHGALASRIIAASRAKSLAVCLTVSRVDGIVVAKSAFHHSLNFESVMVMGQAEEVTDFEEKARALAAITNNVVPDRWDECRPARDAEINATGVLRLSLVEASRKYRSGAPVEDKADVSGPEWSGVVPLALVAGTPQPVDDRPLPDSLRALARRFPSQD
jgi:nitroimidazol reductase NimA-like FMN-containing flavoprotein (pyridoxamine 5'-phosphate oxidase superfamily)